jgi:RNA polymerase subunit RPABC4/transcription elongation factor Spt4
MVMNDAPASAPWMRECRECRTSIKRTAESCPQCGVSQKTEECPACGELMPPKVKYCNACKNFRDLRRFIPGATNVLYALSILLTVGALSLSHIEHFLNRESKTSIAFAAADEKTIYVHILNTGRKPSTLRGYKLQFGELIQDAVLVPQAGDGRDVSTVVPAEGELRIGLLVNGLVPVPGNPPIPPARLNDITATLVIDVDESNGSVQRFVRFQSLQIRTLIDRKLAT